MKMTTPRTGTRRFNMRWMALVLSFALGRYFPFLKPSAISISEVVFRKARRIALLFYVGLGFTILFVVGVSLLLFEVGTQYDLAGLVTSSMTLRMSLTVIVLSLAGIVVVLLTGPWKSHKLSS